MKCNVLVHREVEIKPGDMVVLDINWTGLQTYRHVVRVTESHFGTYAVFDNGTWRPMSTHGITWEKVG